MRFVLIISVVLLFSCKYEWHNDNTGQYTCDCNNRGQKLALGLFGIPKRDGYRYETRNDSTELIFSSKRDYTVPVGYVSVRESYPQWKSDVISDFEAFALDSKIKVALFESSGNRLSMKYSEQTDTVHYHYVRNYEADGQKLFIREIALIRSFDDSLYCEMFCDLFGGYN